MVEGQRWRRTRLGVLVGCVVVPTPLVGHPTIRVCVPVNRMYWSSALFILILCNFLCVDW